MAGLNGLEVSHDNVILSLKIDSTLSLLFQGFAKGISFLSYCLGLLGLFRHLVVQSSKFQSMGSKGHFPLVLDMCNHCLFEFCSFLDDLGNDIPCIRSVPPSHIKGALEGGNAPVAFGKTPVKNILLRVQGLNASVA